MKASILRRLADLEAVAAIRSTPPMILIDVTKLPDGDRDAYWGGDLTVLTRHGAPDHEALPAGFIASIIIDVTPSRRDAWLAGYGRDEPPVRDDGPEEPGQIGTDPALAARVKAEVATARAAALQEDARPPAVWSHDHEGNPILDNDPRLAHIFPKGRG